MLPLPQLGQDPRLLDLRLKRRKAFSKLSSSRTCTTGIRHSPLFVLRIEAPSGFGGRGGRISLKRPGKVKLKPRCGALRRYGAAPGWAGTADSGPRSRPGRRRSRPSSLWNQTAPPRRWRRLGRTSRPRRGRVGPHVVEVGLAEQAAHLFLVHPLLRLGEGLAAPCSAAPRRWASSSLEARVAGVHQQRLLVDVDRPLVVPAPARCRCGRGGSPRRSSCAGRPSAGRERLPLDRRIGVEEGDQPAVELVGEGLRLLAGAWGRRGARRAAPAARRAGAPGLLQPGPLGLAAPRPRRRLSSPRGPQPEPPAASGSATAEDERRGPAPAGSGGVRVERSGTAMHR